MTCVNCRFPVVVCKFSLHQVPYRPNLKSIVSVVPFLR